MNRAGNVYVKNVEGLLTCTYRQKWNMKADLKRIVQMYLDDNPEAVYEDLVGTLGTPEHMADMLLQDIPQEERRQDHKKRKRVYMGVVALLICMLVYIFVIQPMQQKEARLEDFRNELYIMVQDGMDLCGDRLDRTDDEVFSSARDTFQVAQGRLFEKYCTVYDDMVVYNTPEAMMLLGEYSTRTVPADYTAYSADSGDTVGQIIYISTQILYDACGDSAKNMEDVLHGIEADERTAQVVTLIEQWSRETAQKVQDPNMLD